MTFSLQPLSESELGALAASRVPEALVPRLLHDALPPAFVAARALDMRAKGHPEPWCSTFLIIDDHGERKIVGGCGFKTAPDGGRVEVGYGVAPAARGRGAATAAVMLLLDRAFEAGAQEVVAEVAPTNLASIRVVRKAGFVPSGSRVDDAGEVVVVWVRRRGRIV
jgi:RimJ/RimL family protein N-acetyltransferase